MKILIIGASGQLGTDLVRVMKENKESYKAPTKQECDITQAKQIQEYLDKEKPDAIINCAALHNVDLCEEEPELARKYNTEAVETLAEYAKKGNIKFMTLSTDYVFDGKKKEGYTEEDIPNPLMIYGKTKLKGEQKVQKRGGKYFIIRTQSLYGQKGPSGKGLHFVDLMLKLSKEKEEIKVDQCQMAPTWAYPLAKNMLALLKTEHYGLYHMSCEGKTTWYLCAKKIMELTKNPVKITPVSNDFYPKKFKRPENTYLINQNLKKIHLNLMPSWEKALEGYLKEKGLLQ